MRKGPAINVVATLVLVPRGQMEGINGTPETLGWHYKRASSQ